MRCPTSTVWAITRGASACRGKVKVWLVGFQVFRLVATEPTQIEDFRLESNQENTRSK